MGGECGAVTVPPTYARAGVCTKGGRLRVHTGLEHDEPSNMRAQVRRIVIQSVRAHAAWPPPPSGAEARKIESADDLRMRRGTSKDLPDATLARA